MFLLQQHNNHTSFEIIEIIRDDFLAENAKSKTQLTSTNYKTKLRCGGEIMRLWFNLNEDLTMMFFPPRTEELIGAKLSDP